MIVVSVAFEVEAVPEVDKTETDSLLDVSVASGLVYVDVDSRVVLSTLELLSVSVLVSVIVLLLVEENISSVDVELMSVVKDHEEDNAGSF